MTPVRRSAARRRGGSDARGLRIVRRATPPAQAAPPSAVTPAFPQCADASPRQLALFEIVRARACVVAAIHGICPATAESPTRAPDPRLARAPRYPVPGRWSIREMVLHLHAWDLEWERALEPALSGVRPAWLEHGLPELARLNEALLAPLRRIPWEEALRRLHAGHAHLLEAVESLPEEPATLWTREHPLGGILALVPEHDRHHAEVIQEARTAATPSPRTP